VRKNNEFRVLIWLNGNENIEFYRKNEWKVAQKKELQHKKNWNINLILKKNSKSYEISK
jgi:hypothetical protein